MSDEKIIFVTKLKGLELVKVPMGLSDSHGNKVKSERIKFTYGPYGASFSTDKKEEIDWLKNHEYFKLGKIFIVAKEDLETVPGVAVSNGIKTEVEKTEPETPKKSEHPISLSGAKTYRK